MHAVGGRARAETDASGGVEGARALLAEDRGARGALRTGWTLRPGGTRRTDRADGTTRADGAVVIAYHGAPVTILRGNAAARFAGRVADADPEAAQQLTARATGNFKRGNERPHRAG